MTRMTLVHLARFVLLAGLVALPAGDSAAVPFRPRAKKGADQPVRVLIPAIGRGEKAVVARLRELNFQVTVVPWRELVPARLRDADVLLLPTQWGDQSAHYDHLEKLQPAVHRFVQAGGGLLVCQPNPEKTGFVTPTLLPYPIKFQNSYDGSKPERVNLAPRHFITRGLKESELPFPADPMLELDQRYQILVRQKSTGWASLAVCPFGDGRVVVQTANETRGATIPFSDEVLRRMVLWAAGRDDP